MDISPLLLMGELFESYGGSLKKLSTAEKTPNDEAYIIQRYIVSLQNRFNDLCFDDEKVISDIKVRCEHEINKTKVVISSGRLVIKTVRPQKKLKENNPAATSGLQALLEKEAPDAYLLFKDSPGINLHMIFIYHDNRYPTRDHDNYMIKPYIDTITSHLLINDTGLLCETHFSTYIKEDIIPGMYIIASPKNLPWILTKNELLSFLKDTFS